MPSLNDNFMLVAAEGAVTNMASPGKALGATGFNIASATGWPTTTGFIVAIREVDASGVEVPGTYTEWVATLSGTAISLGSMPSPVVGSDQVYAAGVTTQVYIPVSSTRDNRLVNTLLVQHNQDGTHGALTAASLAVSGDTTVTTLEASGAVAIAGALTLSKSIQLPHSSTTSTATLTPNIDNDPFFAITALAANLTVAAPSGTPYDGQILTIRILDNGTPRTISWDSIYEAIQVTLPSTTVANKLLYISARYNSSATKWDVLAVGQQ